ncbi:Mor transcription activator family protein [Sansalvadorimonas verongulae]|uniref:Mor transcription activator family protein n=1 Tax=Sansalvadorimonas verongulae TaxID=2172824 RepID=UPI0018AD28C0|nr:Mor transcription activator family protein [Sansalvadorimonas verongulae]
MNYEPDIVATIGRESTIALERAFGGRRKYIAQKIKQGSPIVEVIGWEAAQQLSQRFGGMQLYIPQTLALQARNRAIIHQRLQGFTAQDLARSYGLVARTIRNICFGCGALHGLRARNRLKILQQGFYGRAHSGYRTGFGGASAPNDQP